VAGLILAVALFCCCYIWLYDKAAPVYLVEVKVLHRSPLVSAKTKASGRRITRGMGHARLDWVGDNDLLRLSDVVSGQSFSWTAGGGLSSSCRADEAWSTESADEADAAADAPATKMIFSAADLAPVHGANQCTMDSGCSAPDGAPSTIRGGSVWWLTPGTAPREFLLFQCSVDAKNKVDSVVAMIMLPADNPDSRPLALALSRDSSSHGAVLAVAIGSAVKYFALEAQLSLFPSGGYRELMQSRPPLQLKEQAGALEFDETGRLYVATGTRIQVFETVVEKEGRQKQLVDIKLRSPNDIVQIMIGGRDQRLLFMSARDSVYALELKCSTCHKSSNNE